MLAALKLLMWTSQHVFLHRFYKAIREITLNEKSRHHNNVLYVIFYELSDDASYYLNIEISLILAI